MHVLAASFRHLTLPSAFDLAIALEAQARDRYLDLARVTEGHGFSEVGAFFASMARLEERHRVTLDAERLERCGDQHTAVAPALAALVPVLHGPQSEAEALALSLREALQFAHDGEARARAFFLATLEVLEDAGARGLFAQLAEEELEHLALVQAQLDQLASLD